MSLAPFASVLMFATVRTSFLDFFNDIVEVAGTYDQLEAPEVRNFLGRSLRCGSKRLGMLYVLLGYVAWYAKNHCYRRVALKQEGDRCVVVLYSDIFIQ